MDVIIIKRDDGVTVRYPSIHKKIENVAERIKGEYKIVDISSLPDYTFRDAWNYNLEIDIDKAKEIQKERIRVEREKAFKDLDYQFMKALEEGKDYSDITKKKQLLRDLPQKVDACKTLDDIRKVTV